MRLTEVMNGINYTGSITDCEITDLTSDSRKVSEGIVFVCIKGIKSDGHDYAQAAAANGASAIICDHDLGLANQLIVDSTREAFAAMCENFMGHPLQRLKLIGVTGTNGKTSTTFIAKQVLERSGHKCGLIGTIQNMIGDEVLHTEFTTPDTYELHTLFAKMADAGCEFAVMEVSSHALEQGRVAGLHFAAACFTNLSEDHLDFHGTMEAYFAAKAKLFAMTDCAIINIDDEWGNKLRIDDGVELLTYGIDNDLADINARNVEFFADGVGFTLCAMGKEYRVKVPTPGRFSAYNALSAAGCAFAVGASPYAVAEALNRSTGIKGRAEVFPTGRDFTIILDYAHTPDGVENILSSMRAVSKGRLVSLLGCGGDRDPYKRPIMGEAAARLSDFVIVTSDNPRTEDPEEIIRQILPGVEEHDTPYTVIVNRREAMKYAVEHAQPGDVIVMAGKGHEDYQIIGKVKIHFDEREVLREIFDALDMQ